MVIWAIASCKSESLARPARPALAFIGFLSPKQHRLEQAITVLTHISTSIDVERTMESVRCALCELLDCEKVRRMGPSGLLVSYPGRQPCHRIISFMGPWV